MQRMSTRFFMAFSDSFPRNDDGVGVRHRYWNEPTKEERRHDGAGELGGDEARSVGRSDAGKRVRQGSRAVTAGFANDVDAVNQYAPVM